MEHGYQILEDIVPTNVTEDMRRLFLLEIVNWGLPKNQFDDWHNTKAWFPTLRDHVEHLVDYVPSSMRDGTLCEPQILLHFPDENLDYELSPHRDQEPEWANDRKYSAIAGVALTDQTEFNGGLIAWGKGDKPCSRYNSTSLYLCEGDIIVFDPDLWHSGGLNATGDIRMMVYFRWLTRA
jgi:hypothetical protein